MRFWTIWSMPSYPLSERLRRTRDWAAAEIAARLPLRVQYHCALQQIGKATMTSPNVPATPLDEVLRNLPSPKTVR